EIHLFTRESVKCAEWLVEKHQLGTEDKCARRPSCCRAAKKRDEFPPPHEPSPKAGEHKSITSKGGVVHHSKLVMPMSPKGQKRTLRRGYAMSALPPKADIVDRSFPSRAKRNALKRCMFLITSSRRAASCLSALLISASRR